MMLPMLAYDANANRSSDVKIAHKIAHIKVVFTRDDIFTSF